MHAQVAVRSAAKASMRLFGRWRDLHVQLAQLKTDNTELHAKVEQLNARAAQPAAAADRSEDCPICCAAEATIVFRPCKHLAMCAMCAERSRPQRCPVCRTRASRLSSIYRP